MQTETNITGENKMTQDEYFDELEENAEKNAASENYVYGGGFELNKGDYEGAILAKAEYEAGNFS